MFFRNTLKEEIRAQSALAERASTHSPARVVPGPRWHLVTSGVVAQPAWPETRLASALGQRRSCSAGSRARRLTWAEPAVGFISRDSTWLTHWARSGSAKPSWAPAWPSKSGSLWLKGKRKKPSIETEAWGPGYRRSRAPFPYQSWMTDPEPPHSAEPRALLPILHFDLLPGTIYFQK